MQKFKFKLDGLLKVREFKEKQLKIELGEILKEINLVEEKIADANRAISETYDAQEACMRDPSNGQMLQFFPLFIQGKKEDIKNKDNLLWSLRKKYDKKVAELATARGEVKVMENFKDKKKTEWSKEKNKKEQEAIEEILMMRSNGSKGLL
ncbi:flagellar export protein FliJ [Bacteriovorax sp. PP10]|uniref:Flagellar FliJ protein n=1 Tax=Bacteriovorax antarcticus TaxID=3088717 RepID=A0ABU5VUU5_9BACT|nr:flagellar export protein FliJ [Bacteriovorax sp. PP10]MEA9356809.1 flagellar export protein FliJ [Bacteriovorax sp. PP10]